ncbi:alpha/beta hydrolase [Cesiribacter andamanensis]|uniref:Acetoin dehydrogenase E2 subunit dihydrolipoyllysine-residue acetyltransferase n=1 Tax=Cesiribacter andamanensis AMV16 TaxID=1279009 RepID=M7NVG5_9BACT|nr:alpha/beta fold hydrolase [Cesiribacter andamanensis]EMR02464.1 acetoin dehydrogenase E2 subunit dihydrolipoyllysine-residue acetyltransferase [Cesiribacter andamanensis AMV16]
MKVLISILGTLALLYALLCLLLYLLQENFIFFPQQLPQDYRFRYGAGVEERYIPTAGGMQLHGLLFRADSLQAAAGQRRLVFFLHGNAGSLASWGDVAPSYTRLGYDVFLLDYRGYGKSGGSLRSQQQLLEDVQAAYRQLLQEYREENTVVLGISLGSGPAAWLAARHKPRLLVLLTPYYSLTDMMRRTMPIVPPFLLKYPLPTYQYLQGVEAPVYLVHGTRDEVIPYASSLRLQQHLKPGDSLIPIEGEYHNSLHASPAYQQQLPRLLSTPAP